MLKSTGDGFVKFSLVFKAVFISLVAVLHNWTLKMAANNEQVDGGRRIGMGIAAVAAGGALLAYGFSKLFDSEGSKSCVQEVKTSFLAPVRDGAARLVLAVDATPACGGCVLIDHESKKIYHYTLDWSRYLKFPSQNQEPDKFETANAFIALKLFSSMINILKQGYDCEEEVTLIKVDNSKFIRQRRTPDHPNEDNRFWEKLQKLRTDINGEWKFTNITEDEEFKAADRLSRGNPINLYREEGYTCKNCDVQALETLHQHLQSIPSKYRA